MSDFTTISVTEANVFTALRSILLAFNFSNSYDHPIEIVRGQVNRVSEPVEKDFMVMWPISRTRLETNTDIDIDSQIIGSILDNVLNVSQVLTGLVGPKIYSPNLAVTGVVVLRQIDGEPGGVGNYQVSQTLAAKSQKFYSGATTMTAPTEMVVQVDVHGPSAGDNAQRLTTLWRDQYAFDVSKQYGAIIAPFYSDEPRQMPFINAEDQYEYRYVVDLSFQINPVVTVSQEFADQLSVKTEDVAPASGAGIGGGGTVNVHGLILVA